MDLIDLHGLMDRIYQHKIKSQGDPRERSPWLDDLNIYDSFSRGNKHIIINGIE